MPTGSSIQAAPSSVEIDGQQLILLPIGMNADFPGTITTEDLQAIQAFILIRHGQRGEVVPRRFYKL